MPQKHDKGVQKRKVRDAPRTKTAPINGQHLATQLVHRGLAPQEILDGYSSRRKDYDA